MRAVGEDVAEVAAAGRAQDLGAHHPVGRVGLLVDRLLAGRRGERGPAAAGVVLRVGVEQLAPQPAQRYVPGSKTWSYSPLNGASVPFSRRTWYCSGVSSARHSCSDFSTFAMG